MPSPDLEEQFEVESLRSTDEYPIVIAAISFVLALVFLPETKDRSIDN